MIDELDRQVGAWIAATLDNVAVRTVAPGEIAQEKCVGLYLMELLPAAPAEQGVSRPFQLSLRYLVTTWADTPEEAHRLLGELAFAASSHPTYDLELVPPAAAAWAAFGVAPRPCFMLRVPMLQERKLPVTKLIRETMILRDSPLVSLQGMVVGPENIPIVGARVELPGFQRTTYTDHKGLFLFSAIPADPARKRLRVKAKGREVAVLAEHGAHMPDPLVIHVDIAEV